MIKQIKKSSLILAAFALSTTAIVTLIHLLTAPKIAEQQALAIQKTLTQIIPPQSYNNAITKDCITLMDENNQTIRIFRARLDNIATSAAIEVVAPDGYSGKINLILALNTDNEILGVRTIDHKETPGLGDKIELKKSNWITQFNHLDVNSADDSRWAVRKDGGMFDQFTGATITPRAVVKSIKRTVLWAKANPEILTQAGNCEKTP